jgi:hypothetical protein
MAYVFAGTVLEFLFDHNFYKTLLQNGCSSGGEQKKAVPNFLRLARL